MRRVRWALLAAALCSLPALAAAPAPAPPARVELKNFHFSPTALTIAVGGTVSWKNLDEEPHTVVGLDAAFRSAALDSNDVFSFKFDRAGTYHYVCSIHPQMTGTIIVK